MKAMDHFYNTGGEQLKPKASSHVTDGAWPTWIESPETFKVIFYELC